MSDSSPHLSQDGGRDAATLDQPLAQLRELLLGIAYPGSPAGSIERRDAALAALQRLEEQLDAAQAAIRELHENMWTVRNGDGPEFVSDEGLKYLRSWFERTERLISNPANEPDDSYLDGINYWHLGGGEQSPTTRSDDA